MILSLEAQHLPTLVAGIYKQGERQPRMHPNGFIQLDVTLDPESRIAEQRLHVWPDNPDDFPRQETRTTIHDHKFDMKSEILVGEIRQIRYHFNVEWDVELEGPTHEIYIASYNRKSDSTLEPTGALVRLATMTEEVWDEGDVYTQPASSFHDTGWEGLTATLMTKQKEYEFHQPRIMVPIGVEPDNDFKRDNVDVDLLWDKIDEAMELLIERISMGSSPEPGTERKV